MKHRLEEEWFLIRYRLLSPEENNVQLMAIPIIHGAKKIVTASTLLPSVYVTVQFGAWNEVTIPWIFRLVPLGLLTTLRAQKSGELALEEEEFLGIKIALKSSRSFSS